MIERIPFENATCGPFLWGALVGVVQAWAANRGVAVRDAVLLLPFAQHLPLARRAWSQAGGWMPRIETTQTLAATLGPGVIAGAGQISFDAANDRLSAARLLASHPWATRWERRDARAFAQAVAQLVEAAHALLRAAACLPPQSRAAHWQACRSRLAPMAGPGELERALARVALEWAASAEAPATDALFGMPASAWIAVQAGGADALTHSLLATAGESTPCAVVDTDAVRDAPFDELAASGHTRRIALAVCDGFEAEAQCAAAQVLSHLAQGQQPVALIAQDRLLVRRVRALLERRQVPLQDETGWKLSTTRAGAQVMNALRAADARADTDALLDWLKGLPAGRGAAMAGLESQLRRKAWSRVDSVDADALEGSAQALWLAARDWLSALVAPPRKALGGWGYALGAALRASGAWPVLQADDAGQQVLAALGLAPLPVPGSAWDANRRGPAMALDEFSSWVDAVLEQAPYLPSAAGAIAAQVVITPLAQAMLRPFAAVVMPGVDATHLGPGAAPPALLGETLGLALGLPGSAARRDAQVLAFAQALRAPRSSLLRRRTDANDPLAASPLLERLALCAQRADAALAAWADPRLTRTLPAQPIVRPAPQASLKLPERISASACEALRACPYRFFALHVLGLREPDELDDELEKRDYGTWLHRVLFEFHCSRGEPEAAPVEVAKLLATGSAQQAAMGFAAADFLPFAAAFKRFAPGYIVWLHGRDTAGARWVDGELNASVRPSQMQGVELHGRIDRIDSVPGRGGAATQLIDYKTDSTQSLRSRVRQPLEDTQLAFYAALLAGQTPGAIEAMYLGLDDAKGIVPVPHPHVADSARQLVAGLAADFEQMQGGAGLPALGEGSVCEHCEARGLCRRDHWAGQ